MVVAARTEGSSSRPAWTSRRLARGLALDMAQIEREADAYAARCDLLPSPSRCCAAISCRAPTPALSSVRGYPGGAFAGLAAGLAYSTPARTYFRDGYWTMQLLLRIAPQVVAQEIDLLATCVQSDGEGARAASSCQGPHSAMFEAYRLAEPALATISWRPGEWWSDHFDSPLFFVIAVGEHVAATGDTDMALRHWPKLLAVLRRYLALRGPQGLPVKPHNDRDWADNVYRDGLVAYDLGLWVGALEVLARLGATLDPIRPGRAGGRRGQAAAALAIDRRRCGATA